MTARRRAARAGGGRAGSGCDEPAHPAQRRPARPVQRVVNRSRAFFFKKFTVVGEPRATDARVAACHAEGRARGIDAWAAYSQR